MKTLQELIPNYKYDNYKKVRIITIKNDIIDLKPVIWIKSIFMVIIGVETTRIGIGIGRINANIYYGSLIFSLIAISGMMVVFILKDKDRDNLTVIPDYIATDIKEAAEWILKQSNGQK